MTEGAGTIAALPGRVTFGIPADEEPLVRPGPEVPHPAASQFRPVLEPLNLPKGGLPAAGFFKFVIHFFYALS